MFWTGGELPGKIRVRRGSAALIALTIFGLSFFADNLLATTVVPISDAELYRRAEVVVRGIVLSNDVAEGPSGQPETVTTIRPLEVLKGTFAGDLMLHQLGGTLPDGRFFQLWGRPEYRVGREVVVFAIARPEGDFQTAEMLLGKFEVWEDAKERKFAVPDLAIGEHEGVTVGRLPRQRIEPDEMEAFTSSPRELDAFRKFLKSGAASPLRSSAAPAGELRPVLHAADPSRKVPLWGNIGDNLWRWNPATAVWTLEGTANMTGGGIAEALGALASWTNHPSSDINFTTGVGSPNLMHLNATTSPCGWTTCLSGAGVIGCGGPRGAGTHIWRGESYRTITGGEVWLRCYAVFDAFSSTITESVLLHELGHAKGLGHSNQNFSAHDVCSGDEAAATMYSTVQNRRTLGTDDEDAIRWLYGDGGNSCSSQPAPTVTSITPSFGPAAGGTLVSIAGTDFTAGATVTLGGVAASGVTVVNSTAITATTGAHAAGAVNVVVTNPDSQSGTLVNGFTYSAGAGFFTLAPCRVADTRNPNGPYGGPALAANSERTFTVAGQCGIPLTAKAISVNITITQPSDAGNLRLYAEGTGLPLASTINYRAGQTRANNAIAALGATGGLGVRCDQLSGSVQLIIDVNGFFE